MYIVEIFIFIFYPFKISNTRSALNISYIPIRFGDNNFSELDLVGSVEKFFSIFSIVFQIKEKMV